MNEKNQKGVNFVQKASKKDENEGREKKENGEKNTDVSEVKKKVECK